MFEHEARRRLRIARHRREQMLRARRIRAAPAGFFQRRHDHLAHARRKTFPHHLVHRPILAEISYRVFLTPPARSIPPRLNPYAAEAPTWLSKPRTLTAR